MEYYEFSIFCLGLVIAGMVLTEIFHAARLSIDKSEAPTRKIVPLNEVVEHAEPGPPPSDLQPQALTR